MAKAVYTVVFEVSSHGVKVTAPELPGFYFTAETTLDAEFECKQYVEAFLRFLRKNHKSLPSEPKNFSIQTMLIEVDTPRDKNAADIDPLSRS